MSLIIAVIESSVIFSDVIWSLFMSSIGGQTIGICLLRLRNLGYDDSLELRWRPVNENELGRDKAKGLWDDSDNGRRKRGITYGEKDRPIYNEDACVQCNDLVRKMRRKEQYITKWSGTFSLFSLQN